MEGSADRDAPADASSFSVSLASARVFFLPSRSQSFPCFCRRRSLDSSVLSLLAHALFPSRRLFRFASFTHSILSLSLSFSAERSRSPLFSSRFEAPSFLRHFVMPPPALPYKRPFFVIPLPSQDIEVRLLALMMMMRDSVSAREREREKKKEEDKRKRIASPMAAVVVNLWISKARPCLALASKYLSSLMEAEMTSSLLSPFKNLEQRDAAERRKKTQ